MKQFLSTKTYTHAEGLSCCFRQWRATASHCHFLHGYALQVKMVFTAPELDARGWVANFGGLKPVKAWLQKMFDHTTVVAVDDPLLETFEELNAIGLIQLRVLPAVGCERFAEYIFDEVTRLIRTLEDIPASVSLVSVEVREHESNSAICKRKDVVDAE